MSDQRKTRKNGHHGSNAKKNDILRFSNESLLRVRKYEIDKEDKDELEELERSKQNRDKRELEEA